MVTAPNYTIYHVHHRVFFPFCSDFSKIFKIEIEFCKRWKVQSDTCDKFCLSCQGNNRLFWFSYAMNTTTLIAIVRCAFPRKILTCYLCRPSNQLWRVCCRPPLKTSAEIWGMICCRTVFTMSSSYSVNRLVQFTLSTANLPIDGTFQTDIDRVWVL